MRLTRILVGVLGCLTLASSSYAQYAPYNVPRTAMQGPAPYGIGPGGAAMQGGLPYAPSAPAPGAAPSAGLTYPPPNYMTPGYPAPGGGGAPMAGPYSPSPYGPTPYSAPGYSPAPTSPAPYSPNPYSPTPYAPAQAGQFPLPSPGGPAPTQNYAPSAPQPYVPSGMSPGLGSPSGFGSPFGSPSPLGAPGSAAWPGSPTQPFADPISTPPQADGGPDDGSSWMDGGPTGGGGGGAHWFGSLAGLIMSRDKPNPVPLTVPIGTDMPALMTTQQSTVDQYRGGFEARVGRTLGCRYAIEGVYWMTEQFVNQAQIVSPTNSLDAFFDTGTLTSGASVVSGRFNGAHIQQQTRTDAIYNVEVNLLQQALCNDCGSRFGMIGLVGARYIRFHEAFVFESAAAGTNFGDNGGTTAGIYDVGVTNNMVGGQIGSRMHYYLLPKLRLYATPKVGLLANTIDHRVRLGVEDGTSAYNLRVYKTDAAMLGQIDLGTSWQVLPRFSLFAAYRIMGISRIALADNQIPPVVADLQAVQHTNTNADLIMHGLVAGGQFVF